MLICKIFELLLLYCPIFDSRHAVTVKSEAKLGVALYINRVSVCLGEGRAVSIDNVTAGGAEHNSLGSCHRIIGEANVENVVYLIFGISAKLEAGVGIVLIEA